MSNEFAPGPDFDAHLKAAWQDAHQIWANIRAYIPKYVPLATPVNLAGSMTMNGTFHDLSLAAYVAPTVFKICVEIRMLSDIVTLALKLRPNGSTNADGETQSNFEVVDAADANMQARSLTDYKECSMVDQTIEYAGSINGGSVGVFLLGYWKTGV